MALPWLAALDIIGGLMGIGKTWVENWQTRQTKRAESDARIAEAKVSAEIIRIQKQADADVDWDKSAVDQMQSSWKDEWFTILLSVPAILAFIPGMKQYVFDGFKALEEMPTWYIYCFVTAVAASFGMRKLIEHVEQWRGMSKK
jgi:hypothetical protein